MNLLFDSRMTNCPSLPRTKGFPGMRVFSAKTVTDPGKPRQLVTLLDSPALGI